MGQELLSLSGHLCSVPILSGVRVARSLILCTVLCRSLFVLFFLFCCSFYCLTFFDLRLHRQTFLVFIYDLPDKMMFMSIDTDETRNICKFVAPEFTLSFCGVSVVKSLVVCGGCLHHYLSYCLFFELRFPFIPLVSSSFP